MTIPAPFLIPTEESQFTYSGVRYRPAAGTTMLALVTEAGREIGYLERGHIFVWKSVNGFVTSIPLVRPDDYNFDLTGTGIILVEPSLAGEEFILVRDTPLEEYIVFADGATLTAEQLNRLARVSLYRDQEQADAFASGGGGGGGGGGPGSGGTVVRVVGGAGMDGDITVSGTLNVGAGAGITALSDSVAINRTMVDSWYASFGHGHNNATTALSGFMSSADKVILDELASGSSTLSLDALTDVTITGPLANEVLVFDGIKWKNSLPGGSGDVRIDRSWSTATTGVVKDNGIRTNALDWRAATQVVINFQDEALKSQETLLRGVPIGATLLVNHATGQLSWRVQAKSFTATEATYAVNTPGPAATTPAHDAPVSVVFTLGSSGVTSLTQLNDVTLTSPANDQILKYNSTTSQWVNAASPASGGVSAVSGTAPIAVATGTTTPVVSIAAATTSASGSMSGADKTKLDGVAPGATANSTDAQLRDRSTHTGSQTASTISDFTASSREQVEATLLPGANITLTLSGSGASRTITITGAAAGGGGGVTSVSGTAPIGVTNGTTTPAITIAAATTSAAGSMSGADKTKLDAMATNAQLRDRATHTGTQAASTISDFTASSRAEVEAMLTQGANITLTPSGSGATRTIAISSTAAGGGGAVGTITSDRTFTTAISGAVLSGAMRLNAASWGATTQLVIHEVASGTALNDRLALMALKAGDQIRVDGPSRWGLFSITAAGTLASAQITIGVSFISSAGALPTNGSLVTLTFTGGGVTKLGDLTDVVLTTPATDQVLKFNGSQWVNAAAPAVGRGTAVLGVAAIASGASATTITVAAAGVATTDVIDWGFNTNPNAVTGYNAASTTGCLVITAFPSAGNINFVVSNPTAASITPGALTLNWTVVR
jgi:hypothetical protein